MFKLHFILLFAQIIVSINAFSKLASYIKLCKRTDENFNGCVIKNGNEAIPFIVQSDPIYHIPSFTPLKLNHVSLEASRNLKLSATDIEVHGIENAQLKNANWNLETKEINVTIFCPLIKILGNYKINGRILIMNLNGTGLMNNTYDALTILANINYDLYERNNKEYMKFTSFHVTIKSEKTVLNFDNILNNAQLSKHINEFINQHIEIIDDELTPSIENIFRYVFLSIVEPIIEKVPFDNIVAP